ncbi:MAG: BRO family protein [Nostoc sp.]|uniref:BRO-N domain-containing protein n=1 Tax=Nostoc sp. TaxID=1180 RepID=UPI002FEE8A7D
MTNLSVFNFESHEVRTLGTALEPWFVASDICEILEIKSPEDAYSRLDEDEKQLSVLPIAGQNRSVMIINESGIYHLMFSSRKPAAIAFRKWITSEVIPAIRKTGSYSAIANPALQLPPITSAKLVKLTNEVTTITNRINELRQLLSQEELKLQDAKFAQVKEAEIYKAANPEALKAALLCDEILKRAKQDNPFRRN